jgi:hypothetical protein
MNSIHPLFRGIINSQMPGIGDLGLLEHQRELAREEAFADAVSSLMETGAVFDPLEGDMAAEAISNAAKTTLALLTDALRSGDDAEVGRIVRLESFTYAERLAREAVEREEREEICQRR